MDGYCDIGGIRLLRDDSDAMQVNCHTDIFLDGADPDLRCLWAGMNKTIVVVLGLAMTRQVSLGQTYSQRWSKLPADAGRRGGLLPRVGKASGRVDLLEPLAHSDNVL